MATSSQPSPTSTPSPEALLEERQWLRGLSASLVGPIDADDLAQDAWLALLERRRRDGNSAVTGSRRGWLAGAARTLALAKRRKDGTRRGQEHMYAEDVGLRLARSDASVDELLAQTELEREVVELLLELKEPTRGTLVLCFQGGMTAAEIARRTGVPQGTVRRRMMDGLNLLRSRMDARHGERRAWAPALVGIAPGALKAALVSSGSGLAAGAALTSMKKLMWLAATVLILGACWLARSTWLRHPGSTSDQTLALESELSSPAPSLATAPVSTQPEAAAREPLAIPAPIEKKSAPSFTVVDHLGEPIDSATIIAALAGERHALTRQGAGLFVLDDDGAKALQDRASVPLVVSRSGSWPHTFEVSLEPGEHTLVWPLGVTLEGQLLENGQRPGEPVRLSLKRDVGWSGRPHAAAIDDRWDPIPRSVVADADGSFLLADLPPGWRGWLRIEDSWRFETQSLQSEAVNAEGPSSVVFSILRSPRVTGRVIASPSGEGVADHTVRVDSTHPGEATYITETTTDADGQFTWIPWPGATSAEFRFGAHQLPGPAHLQPASVGPTPAHRQHQRRQLPHGGPRGRDKLHVADRSASHHHGRLVRSLGSRH